MLSSDKNHGFFLDDYGRAVLLKGVNFVSTAKYPKGQPSRKTQGFFESGRSGKLTYVGQAGNLDQVDVHLKRLKSWGMNFLRYIVTWEAIEHEGPKKFDDEYINYTIQVLRKCHDHGFKVLLDPHQDVFSRFSGGSGAPYWALVAAGLQPEKFQKTWAAVVHSQWRSKYVGEIKPDEFPPMIWVTNLSRYAAHTLFTLFFAGRKFAPRCKIDGINIQDWLQTHFIQAVGFLNQKIAEQDPSLLDSCLVGWDTLNEPHTGMIKFEALDTFSEKDGAGLMKVGPMPTPFQGFLLASGFSATVEEWAFGGFGPKQVGYVTLDPEGENAFIYPSDEIETETTRVHRVYGWHRDKDWDTSKCLWALHGVWDDERQLLLKSDYFKDCDFFHECWVPHVAAFRDAIRESHSTAYIFYHVPVMQELPNLHILTKNDPRCAYSFHYYDGLTLVTKQWHSYNVDQIGYLRGKYGNVLAALKVGLTAIRKSFEEQLAVLKEDGISAFGPIPPFVGEIGIPYDMDNKKAYAKGEYKNQITALDANLNACEAENLLNCCIWCYDPLNAHKYGDFWNGEDLSIWSPDDCHETLLNSLVHWTKEEVPPFIYSHTKQLTEQFLQFLPARAFFAEFPALHNRRRNFDSGSRALNAFVRPFPVATVGRPTSSRFELSTSTYNLKIIVSPESVGQSQGTVVFLPWLHFSHVYKTWLSSQVASNSTRSRVFESDVGSISVSHGFFKLVDQYLVWTYDVPESKEIIVTLTVTDNASADIHNKRSLSDCTLLNIFKNLFRAISGKS